MFNSDEKFGMDYLRTQMTFQLDQEDDEWFASYVPTEVEEDLDLETT